MAPICFRWLGYGTTPAEVPHVVTNYLTAPPPLPPFSTLFRRALGVGYQEAVAISNDPAFEPVGSSNIVCWADPERRVAAALLPSGRPFLDPELDYLFEVLRQITCPELPR